jgi:glycosyltransferase involved in cell wall biosynthesis
MQYIQQMQQIRPLSLVYGEYSENTGFRTRIEMIKLLLKNTMGTAGDWLTFERGVTKKIIQVEGINRIVRLSRNRTANSLAMNYLLTRLGVVIAEFSKNYDLIIAHSFNSIFIASGLKKRFKIPVLLDIHGLWLEEMLSWSGSNSVLRKTVLKKIEKIMLESADGFIYASNPLKSILVDRYPELAQKPSVVIPCLPDLEHFRFDSFARKSLRENWGWEDCIIVVHSGVNAPWVDISGIRHLLKIGGCIPGIRFLFLTNQLEEWEKILDDILDEVKIKILSVDHKDMHQFLSAADIGLVARIDSPVNRVASPTKIAEYLAIGLPVFMTAGIGDYDDWVGQNRLGICVSNLSKVSFEGLQQIFTSLLRLDKNKISSWAKANLSLNYNYDGFSRICIRLTG